MVLQVQLRHLTLLLGEDISELPQPVLIERIKALFGFLGEIGKVEVLDDAVQLHLREAAPQKSAESAKLAERATKRAREGDYPRAVELLRRALQLSPTLPTAHRDLAMNLMELGQYAEAKDALIDALKLDATDAWSFVVLGNLYAKHEANPDQARRFYERALELKPGDAWALNGLASALAESGDQSGALFRFDEAIQSNPEFANAWLGKALLQLRGEMPVRASALGATCSTLEQATGPEAEIDNRPDLSRLRSTVQPAIGRSHNRQLDACPTGNWTLITRGRRTWGVEVKASATPTQTDIAGLRRLAAQCGNDFAGGVLIHAGAHTVTLGDPRFLAVPLAKLWEM